MALHAGTPVARKAVVAMMNAATLLNALASREERIAADQGYSLEPYTATRFKLLRSDAAALIAYAQETCHHPDEYYNPPDAEDETTASCELCHRNWPRGTDRDSERGDTGAVDVTLT